MVKGEGCLFLTPLVSRRKDFSLKTPAACPDWWTWVEKLDPHGLAPSFLILSWEPGCPTHYSLLCSLKSFLRTTSTWNPVGVHCFYDLVVLSNSGSFILRSPLLPHTKGTFSNPSILSNERIILIFIFLLLAHFLIDSGHSCGNPK